MKAKKYWILAAAILIGSIVVYGAARAELDRGTLQGVKGFHVLIENLSSEAKAAGLSRKRLKTLVELKLRMAGVKVLTEKEGFAKASSPCLYLNLNIMEKRAGLALACAISASLNFKQLVILLRDRNILCIATTWDKQQSGLVVGTGNGMPATELINFVEEMVEDLVDAFLNDYLAANPKTDWH